MHGLVLGFRGKKGMRVMVERGLKRDLRAQVEGLRKKAEEFERKGDLERAERCRFIAESLELFLEKELSGKQEGEVKGG